MAIHRTYLVRMPSNAGTMPYLDILVEGVPNLTYPPLPVQNGTPIPVGGPQHAIVGPGMAFPIPTQNVLGPSNWQVFGAVNGDGAFLEWRGRAIKFDAHFYTPTVSGLIVTPNFVPRLWLGWKLTIVPTFGNDCPTLPVVGYSKSLILPSAWYIAGAPPTVTASGFNLIIGATLPFDDPTYDNVISPVIRLYNDADVQGSPDATISGPGTFYVHLDIYEQKDDDRNPGGIG